MQKRHARRTLAALAASAAIVAGLALGSPAPAFAADGVCTMATTAALNLRDNASLQGRVIDVMPQGTSVEVYGMTQDGWYRVNYEGTEGYCYYRWLNFEGTADGTVHDGKQTEMFATCDLNVRTAPSMSGAIIGSLARGTVVSALEQTPDRWVRISFNGTDAWVGDYLA